jgi:hypothetical protein
MALLHNLTESLALRMLAREGIAVIWQLHLAATQAHRNGMQTPQSRFWQ